MPLRKNLLLMRGICFYKTKKKLGCLFLQPRIFFREAEFGVKIYVRGRRLYFLSTALGKYNVEIPSTIHNVEDLEVKVFRWQEVSYNSFLTRRLQGSIPCNLLYSIPIGQLNFGGRSLKVRALWCKEGGVWRLLASKVFGDSAIR